MNAGSEPASPESGGRKESSPWREPEELRAYDRALRWRFALVLVPLLLLGGASIFFPRLNWVYPLSMLGVAIALGVLESAVAFRAFKMRLPLFGTFRLLFAIFLFAAFGSGAWRAQEQTSRASSQKDASFERQMR